MTATFAEDTLEKRCEDCDAEALRCAPPGQRPLPSANVLCSTRTWLIAPLPAALMICLKRFRETGSKIESRVHFPLRGLDLSAFVAPRCCGTGTGEAGGSASTYRLRGLCCHLGESTAGHYVSYVRMGCQWWVCDDAETRRTGEEELLSGLVASRVYTLLYEKE